MKIYRLDTVIADIEIDDKSVFKYSIMGDEVCELNFVSDLYYDFTIADYLIYQGQKFRINTPVDKTKMAANEYNYKIKFEGIKYELGKILFKIDGMTEFPLNSNIEQILDHIITNMNEVSDVTWAKGVCSITPYYDFTFNNENCLEVITKACIEFEVEFEVIQDESGYTINVRDSIGIYEGVGLAYKAGIYSLAEQPASQDNIITKLYAYGASKNIPDSYGSQRIKIDAIDNNTDLYGISEDSIIWDDIYPKFSGEVTYQSSLTFRDSSIDFNINSYLIPGVTAKIVFLSGNLAGYEFEIDSFDYGSKEFTLIQLTDDIGQNLPNATLSIAIGDRYTINDIYMPTAYVTAAETELLSRATTYLEKYSSPLVKYSIVVDARYLRDNGITLYSGEKIYLYDDDMNISKQLRIYSIVQSLADPYKYDIELTDELMMSRMIKLIYGQYDINKRLDQLKKDLKILKNN